MKNIGLVLAGDARDPLVAALTRAGYEVHIAATPARVDALIARNLAEAWIFDARSEGVLEKLLLTGRYLLPADNMPGLLDRRTLSNWIEALLTQLDLALSVAPHSYREGKVNRWGEVKSVWLLAGSAGATSAVQEFLNAFDEPPPVAFIYAQHLDPDQQHQLERFTLNNKKFSLRIADGALALEPDRIVMLSPRRKIIVNKFGQLAGTRSPWGGQHTPDINELLVILTAAGLPSPGVIIFSGMGDDGAASLEVFDAGGGQVWAQSPASAICPAMPQAAIDTGLVQYAGTPLALAGALEAFYKDPV